MYYIEKKAKKQQWFTMLLFSITAILFFGCGAKKIEEQDVKHIGIVSFSQPKHIYQIFAGKIIPYRIEATKKEEEELTQTLITAVIQHTPHINRIYIPDTEQTPNQSAVEYWAEQGKKHGYQWLIIPYIMEWRGAETVRDRYIPPKVQIEYYLFDVEQKKVLERSRYFESTAVTLYDLQYTSQPNGIFYKKSTSRMDIGKDSVRKMLIDFRFIRNIKEKNIFEK